MRLASNYLAVAGVGGGLESVFQAEVQLGHVVPLPVAQILLPMLAEVGEHRGGLPELAIALEALRGESFDDRLHPLLEGPFPARCPVARRCALRSRDRSLHLSSTGDLSTAMRRQR